MPWSALPDHINSPDEWNGKDDDKNWFIRWRKNIKGWFAYGSNATEWWARWRRSPKTLLALFGHGRARFEAEFYVGDELLSTDLIQSPVKCYALNIDATPYYLSRVQKYLRWHVQLQWPLFVAFHWYWRRQDVPTPSDSTESGFADGKIVFGYLGAKRDGDNVYWFPAIYLGFNWK